MQCEMHLQCLFPVKMLRRSVDQVLSNKARLAVFGMIHLDALPGCPRNTLPVSQILEKACEEANIYKNYDLDGLIVENMNDLPYLHTNDVGHEITAAMSLICAVVKSTFGIGPVGVQVLAGANKQALAVAKAAELDFIRAEGFVYSHIADEGLMNACAGELLRYRKHIGAEGVKVFTDIKKKHSSHSLTSDISVGETAKAAEFFLSDGVIVTGESTGQEPNLSDVDDVKSSIRIPVLIGSGITNQNLRKFFKSADGVIIGSHFKKNGQWWNGLDQSRIEHFMDTLSQLETK